MIAVAMLLASCAPVIASPVLLEVNASDVDGLGDCNASHADRSEHVSVKATGSGAPNFATDPGPPLVLAKGAGPGGYDALAFSGRGALLTFKNSSWKLKTLVGRRRFGVAMVIRPDRARQPQVLFGNSVSPNVRGLNVGQNLNTVSLSVNSDGAKLVSTGPQPVALGEWTLVTWTVDRTVEHSNGLDPGTQTVDAAGPVGARMAGDLFFGWHSQTIANAWDGQLAHLLVVELDDRETWDADIASIRAHYVSPSAPARHTATLGDSISASGHINWPTRLELILAEPVTVNGAGGWKMDDCLSEYQAHIDPYAGVDGPIDTLALACGSNDIAHDGETAASLLAQWDEMVSDAVAEGMVVYAVALIPRHGGGLWSPAKQQTLEDLNAAWAADDRVVFVDAYSAMEDPVDPGRIAPGLHTGDFTHPSPEGEAVIASEVAAAMGAP